MQPTKLIFLLALYEVARAVKPDVTIPPPGDSNTSLLVVPISKLTDLVYATGYPLCAVPGFTVGPGSYYETTQHLSGSTLQSCLDECRQAPPGCKSIAFHKRYTNVFSLTRRWRIHNWQKMWLASLCIMISAVKQLRSFKTNDGGHIGMGHLEFHSCFLEL